MKNKAKPIIDALIQIFAFTFLLGYINSPMVEKYNLGIQNFMAINIILVLILCSIYFMILKNERNNKNIVLFLAKNTVSFLGLIFFVFSLRMTFHIDIFPTRELSNADGIYIIIISTTFLFFNFLARLFLTIGFVVRNYLDKIRS